MGCKCGQTCVLGICCCNTCPPATCGCEGDIVSDECCLNQDYYAYLSGTANGYVKFSFGYVLGTDTSSSNDIASGVLQWYFSGSTVDTSTLYSSLPSGGCLVDSGSASNCCCSSLDFQYGTCPFYNGCNGGQWPENPTTIPQDNYDACDDDGESIEEDEGDY
jgi:hypothetical protein